METEKNEREKQKLKITSTKADRFENQEKKNDKQKILAVNFGQVEILLIFFVDATRVSVCLAIRQETGIVQRPRE